jgi:hypothetical protein
MDIGSVVAAMSRWLRRFLLLLVLAVSWSCLLFQDWYATSGSSWSPETTTSTHTTSTTNSYKNKYTSPRTRRISATQDDVHSSQTALLPLQPWELESLQGLHQAGLATTMTNKQKQQVTNDSCQPPNGIPAACCLGTFAGMGRIITNRRHTCAHTATALENLTTTTNAATSNNRGCDVCALVEQLRETNQSMAFVGDSMSHQIFQGLVCEFYRRRYIVQESTVSLYRDEPRQHRRRQRDPLSCPSNHNHCLHMARSIQVSSPTWEDDPNDPSNTTSTTTVTFKFFHIYRLPFADLQQEHRVLEAASILVVNFGLHWGANYGINRNNNHATLARSAVSPNKIGTTRTHAKDRLAWLTSPDNPPTPEHLENVLTTWLRKAQLVAAASATGTSHRHHHHKPLQILMRETSTQHFDAVGGDYSFVKQRYRNAASSSSAATSTTRTAIAVQGPRNVKRKRLQCVSFYDKHDEKSNGINTSATFTSGWREQVIRNAAHRANYSIRELPIVAVGATNAMTPNELPPPNPLFTRPPAPVVTILPFAEWTRPLHDLHPYDDDDEGGGDCTHYCSSPFLYMPLWRSIRVGIL